MNKRLLIISLLTLINLTLFSGYQPLRAPFRPIQQQPIVQPAMAGQAGGPQFNFINQPMADHVIQGQFIAQNIPGQPAVIPAGAQNTLRLNQIQQGYALQPTNDTKAQYINYILDNNDENFTVQQKIVEAQYLAQVIANDLSLHTGWLYNTDQAQVDWLKDQKLKIARKLVTLQWQAKSLGEKTLYYTAVGAAGAAALFCILLAGYALQDQHGKRVDANGVRINPDYKPKEFGDIAWMPIEGAIHAGQAAAIPVKFAAKGAYQTGAMAIAAGKVLGDYAVQGGKAITNKGGDLIQTSVHSLAKNLVEATKPPLWSEASSNQKPGINTPETTEQSMPAQQAAPAKAASSWSWSWPFSWGTTTTPPVNTPVNSIATTSNTAQVVTPARAPAPASNVSHASQAPSDASSSSSNETLPSVASDDPRKIAIQQLVKNYSEDQKNLSEEQNKTSLTEKIETLVKAAIEKQKIEEAAAQPVATVEEKYDDSTQAEDFQLAGQKPMTERTHYPSPLTRLENVAQDAYNAIQNSHDAYGPATSSPEAMNAYDELMYN